MNNHKSHKTSDRSFQHHIMMEYIRYLRDIFSLASASYDLSSLRILGTVGEPINPEAWQWYHEAVGQGRCPVVDTFWQTETVSADNTHILCIWYIYSMCLSKM